MKDGSHAQPAPVPAHSPPAPALSGTVAEADASSALRRVDVLIVTYQGDDVLGPCLSSLRRACGDEPRVIVADNAPNEKTRRLVERTPNARYLPSPGNPGFAGGNNRALTLATREFVLLLNNDTLIESAASFTALIAFLDAHPACAAAQGTMRLPNSRNHLGGCGVFLTPLGLLYSRGFDVPEAPAFDRPCRCFSGIGAFLMIRRAAIAEAGGFLFRTEFHAYYEETDFCHRLWLAGREVWYVPTPPIQHLLGVTSGRFPRAEIMGRFLRNQRFSLSVCLGFWGRLFLLPVHRAVLAAYALSARRRGQADLARAVSDALRAAHTPEGRAAIRAARAALPPRRGSPWHRLRSTMRVPGLRYWLSRFRRG